jgi:hypothetical protein
MKLCTICVSRQPVLTMSVDADDSVLDSLTTNVDAMKADRAGRVLRTGIAAILFNEGDGRAGGLSVREARVDEAACWYAARQKAIDEEGELDAVNESWIVYLVPVSDRPL